MASDAAPPFGVNPDDILGADERRDRARTVSADLEAIFGEPRAAGAPPRRIGRPVSGLRSDDDRPRKLSPATIGGIAAAALAGIAAGALLVERPKAPPAKPHPAALPIEMTAPPATPQASDAALAAPAQPLAPTQLAPVPALPKAQVKPSRPSAGRGDVMAADRRLRASYAAAIRAGVPRSVLAEDRDRWSAARRRGADDPARLVASYRAIAADLDRAAARRHGRAERHAERSEPRRSLFHPRFLPWWR